MKYWARLKKSDVIELFEWNATMMDEEKYQNMKEDPKTRSIAKPFEAPHRKAALNIAISKFAHLRRF